MTPQPQLEERLRGALRRPEDATWPDERGAFDRFLRHRARRGRVLTARAGLALAAVLVAAALLPGVLADRAPRPGPVRPLVPAGPVVRDPARGFELPIPPGWEATKTSQGPAFADPPTVELVPKGAGPDDPRRVVLQTAILLPEQHPGLPPGEDPGGVADRTGSFLAIDDRASPLGRGRRPDGRPYVWRTRLLPDEVGELAIAWPYHCPVGHTCPQGNRWRVLMVYVGRSDNPAVRKQLRNVAQQVVDTVRPITNALPGGDPAQLDPALQHQPRVTTDRAAPGPGP